MDKNEYLSKEDREELEELIKTDFDFNDISGHKIEFSITGFKSEMGWSIVAEADFSMSLNGAEWVTVNIPVQVDDSDYDSALATAMLGIASGLNDPEILATMRLQLNKQKGLISKGDIVQ